MTTKNSPHDWEALSAYLDEEMTPKERARLESRLNQDQAFREALEELRQTRTVLRSQPRLRAPRNFTLNSEMAGIRPGARPAAEAYPVLRLASALATFFFVVVFVGNLVAERLQPVQVAQQSVARLVPPGSGGGGGGGGGGGFAVAPTEPPAPAAPMLGEAQASPAAMAKSFESSQPTEAPVLVVTPEVQQAMPTSSPTETPVQSFFQPDRTPGEALDMAQETGAEIQPTPVSGRQSMVAGWSLLQVIQVLLALLAIGTGVAAVLLRRSSIG